MSEPLEETQLEGRVRVKTWWEEEKGKRQRIDQLRTVGHGGNEGSVICSC